MTTLGATPSTTTFPAGGSTAGGLYKAGYYLSYPGTLVIDKVQVLNVFSLSRVTIPKSVTVDRIGCACQTVAASSTVRLGIYTETADGLPGDLVLDAGTVNTASGTGDKPITISQALAAGAYWIGGAAQGGTPTMSTWTGAGLGITPDPYPYSPTYCGFKSFNTVSGALPTPFVIEYVDQPIRVWLRYV